MDRAPKPPLVVRGDELAVFADVAALRRGIEVLDVARGAWRVYDRTDLDELDQVLLDYLAGLDLPVPVDREGRLEAIVAQVSATMR